MKVIEENPKATRIQGKPKTPTYFRHYDEGSISIFFFGH